MLAPLSKWMFIALLLVLGWYFRMEITPEWKSDSAGHALLQWRPFLVEADCYSQLARDQRILQGGAWIQKHFAVENWPEGLIPSTTAPFDYCILALYLPLKLLTPYPLDWAGALVSPLLWTALVFFWALTRLRGFNRWGQLLLIAGSAIFSEFIWGSACGRPRHQSLIMVLMAIGLTAEFERWQAKGASERRWNIVAGLTWGFACWTSLFEPVLVVACLIAFNFASRRRENPVFLITFGWVMLAALLLEGVHVFIPPAEYREDLTRWLATIAEVRPLDFHSLWVRLAGIVLLMPLVAWRLLKEPDDDYFSNLRMILVLLVLGPIPVVAWRVWHGVDRERLPLFFLLCLTWLLTLLAFLQSRWIYYAALAELMVLARYCMVSPTRGSRVILLIIFLIGALYGTSLQLKGGRLVHNQPSVELARVATSIDQPGGILAPWWLSPGMLYFSGQPIVAGSSHCGISGIVASAQFYSTASWKMAEQILQERKVRWVMAYDDRHYEFPLLNSSRGILGEPMTTDDSPGDAPSTMAETLVADRFVPAQLHLRAVTEHLKLYEYVP